MFNLLHGFVTQLEGCLCLASLPIRSAFTEPDTRESFVTVLFYIHHIPKVRIIGRKLKFFRRKKVLKEYHTAIQDQHNSGAHQ